jgi:thiamine monophosphate synthase
VSGLVIVERTFGALPAVVDGDGPLRITTAPARAARATGADGLHWPQSRLHLRRRSAGGPRWPRVETASAHSGLAMARARAAGIAIVLVSTAFASQSPSAPRHPRGPVRLGLLARAFPDLGIVALGGITARSVRRLRGLGLAGVAGVSFVEHRTHHRAGRRLATPLQPADRGD